MRAASTRYGKRKVYVAGILLLAGVFLYHGMRSLDDTSEAGAAVVAAADDTPVSCEWEEGGPELFVIRHNELHPEGECARAGKCFVGECSHTETPRGFGFANHFDCSRLEMEPQRRGLASGQS